MTKKVIIGIAIVVALFAIGAVSQKKDPVVKETTTQSQSSIDDYAKKLGATDRKEAYYLIVGAKDGAKYTLDEKTIEIYTFEQDKVAAGLKFLYNDGVEIRRVNNTVFVFHGYTEDDPALEPIMERVK